MSDIFGSPDDEIVAPAPTPEEWANSTNVTWQYEGGKYGAAYSYYPPDCAHRYAAVHLSSQSARGTFWFMAEICGEILATSVWQGSSSTGPMYAATQIWQALRSRPEHAVIFQDTTRDAHGIDLVYGQKGEHRYHCIYCRAQWILDKKLRENLGRCPNSKSICHGDDAPNHYCKTFDERGVCVHTLHCCTCDRCIVPGFKAILT